MQFFLASFLLLPFLLVCIVESLLKLFIPKKRKSVTGEIVLITGAGHGIGRQTAYEFAKLKCKLVLWDINKHGLEETATECKRLGAKAHTFVVDCSNREDIYSSAKKTTKAFLPEMMKNNHGHIVTVASAAGHIGVPFLLAYCSSKFAAVGFHKALTEELSALERTGIKTTCLCPNFINTGFIKNPSTSLGPTLEPEEVVNKLIDGILTEQKMIFVPSSLNFLSLMEKRRKSVAGEIVLITGAGHGIGRQTAYEFAQRKSRLVLWDINKHGVEETAAECRKLGATTHVFVVDCSNREEIYSSVDQVKKEVGDVTIVVNNAGAIYPADLLSAKDEEITKTFEVNILGHFWITKALLPSMIRRNHGHIVTVASVCGHGVIPYLIPYCSSKFAAVGFHRALTSELEALGKTGIKTSCLCPVFVNTGFTKNPSTRIWPVLETEEVVRSLIDGILTNKKMIFVPSYINISLAIERFLPERALAAINRVQDIQFEAVIGHKIKMK
uniref:17beta-estradiol 17-dehydrogenase n=1 Tax=Capra hircus TaxID=9925 RepID=A0A8C2RCS0_CAPHI